jgi:glycosyltransferase involved in cell wall biosynthesis
VVDTPLPLAGGSGENPYAVSFQTSCFTNRSSIDARVRPETSLLAAEIGLGRTPTRQWEGFDALIEIVRLLHLREVPVTVKMVGGGPLLADTEGQARKLLPKDGYESMREVSVDALATIVNNSDVFVSCSRSEAHGRTILEAMYLGVPAVAFRVGGILDYLPDNLLAEVEDTEAIADPSSPTAWRNWLPQVAQTGHERARVTK